nr:hypothetical protein Iba_chr11dCG13540 [Ipomoea batatas]
MNTREEFNAVMNRLRSVHMRLAVSASHSDEDAARPNSWRKIKLASSTPTPRRRDLVGGKLTPLSDNSPAALLLESLRFGPTLHFPRHLHPHTLTPPPSISTTLSSSSSIASAPNFLHFPPIHTSIFFVVVSSSFVIPPTPADCPREIMGSGIAGCDSGTTITGSTSIASTCVVNMVESINGAFSATGLGLGFILFIFATPSHSLSLDSDEELDESSHSFALSFWS